MAEAVWFTAPRQVEIRSEPMRSLEDRDVHVRTLVSGISAGSELLVYRGEAPADLDPDLPTIGGDFRFPVKFAYASVGAVAATGRDVTGVGIGDLVFVHHPHQTEFVVPADAVVPLPPGLAPDAGVFTANLETAVTVVLDAHPRLGESVLVTGQGVVGLLTTMLLRRTGAGRIVTVDAHGRRRDASLRAGADAALAPDDDVQAHLLEITDGRGVDVAIEVSGVGAALQTCIDAVAVGGRVVVASWYGTRDVSLQLGARFHRDRVRMVSSQVSTLDPELGGRWDRSRRMSLVTELLCQLPVTTLITHRVPFREAARAYQLLDGSPEQAIQVVLDHV